MLAIQRKEKIKEIIIKEKKVFVNDLSKMFTVSEETIRRDLDKLEKEGILKKIYGGAILISELNKTDIPFSQRVIANIDEKASIAIKALDLIKDCKSIMVDSSSTVLEVVKLLKDFNNLKVITNSIQVPIKLASSDVEVIGVGGQLNKKTLSYQGNITEESLKRFNADLALISAKGITGSGITDSNELEVVIKQSMMRQSKKIALLMDSSKIGYTAFLNLVDVKDIEYIITDDPNNNDLMKICETNFIKLI